MTCSVKVTPIQADMVSYDAGNEYVWLNFEAAEPQDAETAEGAMKPNGIYDASPAAAYADSSIYVFDSAGGFCKPDAEAPQGVRLGTNNAVIGLIGEEGIVANSLFIR